MLIGFRKVFYKYFHFVFKLNGISGSYKKNFCREPDPEKTETLNFACYTARMLIIWKSICQSALAKKVKLKAW